MTTADSDGGADPVMRVDELALRAGSLSFEECLLVVARKT
jgi:hypothetical protein